MLLMLLQFLTLIANRGIPAAIGGLAFRLGEF
jgi:hypothetical protein